MKKLFVLLISVCFISCSGPGVKVTVTNTSSETVDSVIVTNGFDVARFGKINPKHKDHQPLIFSGTIKSDGSYQAKIYKDGKMTSQPFGYYTNGGALSKSIDITIYNDSIKTTESNSQFY